MKRIHSLVLCFLMCAASVSAQDKIKIKGPDGRVAIVTSPYSGFWEYAEAGTTWTLKKEQNGKLLFKKGSDTLATGKFKGQKLTVKTPTGDSYLNLKTKSDKIKFTFDASGNEWEFKSKTDKIKIRFDGVEYGKVKYYPDTGKLKAKDKNGNTVSEAKGYSALSAAPGVFVVKHLPEDKAAFLVLFLFSSGK